MCTVIVSDWLLIDDGTEVNNNMLFCFTKKLETDAALREHSYHTILSRPGFNYHRANVFVNTHCV